jgi:hypothetical protein
MVDPSTTLAVKLTGDPARAVDVAVAVLFSMPRVAPTVQVAEAFPATSVFTSGMSMLPPPPVAENVTDAPLTGPPFLSVT